MLKKKNKILKKETNFQKNKLRNRKKIYKNILITIVIYFSSLFIPILNILIIIPLGIYFSIIGINLAKKNRNFGKFKLTKFSYIFDLTLTIVIFCNGIIIEVLSIIGFINSIKN